MSTALDLLPSRTFSRSELDHAITFVRDGRSIHKRRLRAKHGPDTRRQADFAEERALRAELWALGNEWRRLDALTPRQMSTLLAVLVEGNCELAAARLCIASTTVKNQMTAIRKVIFGRDYATRASRQIGLGPLAVMVARWIEDAENWERLIP